MNDNVREEAYPGIREGRLSIEVTTHCNLACPHCFARAGNVKPSSLPVNLVKKIVAEGYDTGYRRLHITGGEPLLWEGLWELLDYAFGVGYEVLFMNTNGTLLTADLSKRLSAYNRLSISVSLEGSQAFHDRMRSKDSYRRAVHAIEKALQAGIGLFVFTMATKGLLPELPGFASDLYRRFSGIRHLTLIPITGDLDGSHALSEELFSPEDFLRLVRTVSLLNVYGLRTNVLHDPLVIVASRLLGMPWIPCTEPLYREGFITIMANGRIGLSHSTRIGFGTYRPGMVQKVLASDRYRRAVAPDEAVCPSCKYIGLCRENGMDRPSEYKWDLRGNVPYCVRVLNGVPS